MSKELTYHVENIGDETTGDRWAVVSSIGHIDAWFRREEDAEFWVAVHRLVSVKRTK